MLNADLQHGIPFITQVSVAWEAFSDGLFCYCLQLFFLFCFLTHAYGHSNTPLTRTRWGIPQHTYVLSAPHQFINPLHKPWIHCNLCINWWIILPGWLLINLALSAWGHLPPTMYVGILTKMDQYTCQFTVNSTANSTVSQHTHTTTNINGTCNSNCYSHCLC